MVKVVDSTSRVDAPDVSLRNETQLLRSAVDKLVHYCFSPKLYEMIMMDNVWRYHIFR